MAALAKGSLRRKHAELVLALEGRMQEHHRFVLMMQLRRLETAEQDIAALDQRIAEKLEPYGAQHLLLMQIPGVDWLVAAVLIAEIGIDMSVFLSASHLAAWAGVCPGNHESAGKQRSGRARKGNIHLRTILVGAAVSASRTRGSYLKDKYHRLKARRGPMRAALAIAHKILVAAYHMLAKGIAYQDLGETYLDQIRQTRTVANLKRRIERLGYQVTLEPKAQAAQRWLAKFGQADKWKICLRAARVPRIRSDNGKTGTSDAQSGFQGEGGTGCHQGREDAGRAGAAV